MIQDQTVPVSGNHLICHGFQRILPDHIILLRHLAPEIVKDLFYITIHPGHLFFHHSGILSFVLMEKKPHTGDRKLHLMDPGFHILFKSVIFSLLGKDLVAHRLSHLIHRIIKDPSLQKIRCFEHFPDQIFFLQIFQFFFQLPVKPVFSHILPQKRPCKSQDLDSGHKDHQLFLYLEKVQHCLYQSPGKKPEKDRSPTVFYIICFFHNSKYPCPLRVCIAPWIPASSSFFLSRLIFTVRVLSSIKSLQSQR